MDIIKGIRERSGYTQAELAQKTGLSLRTIQRLESNNAVPKGHTLAVLSTVFLLEPAALQEKFKRIQVTESADANLIRLINLSVLACFGIPFGNLIVPYILWKRKRTSVRVDELGRRILNIQILWSVSLAFLLSIAPFISRSFFSDVPLILIVLFTALAINLIIVCYTAVKLQRQNFDVLRVSLRFI